jgi:hypothetical protein
MVSYIFLPGVSKSVGRHSQKVQHFLNGQIQDGGEQMAGKAKIAITWTFFKIMVPNLTNFKARASTHSGACIDAYQRALMRGGNGRVGAWEGRDPRITPSRMGTGNGNIY